MIGVLGLAGCRKSQAVMPGEGGTRKVRLQLDWFPQTEYGAYYQAQARGFYRDAGLEAESLSGGPGVPAKDLVAFGRAEVGITDGNDVIVAISRGLPLVLVAAEMQHNPQGLLFHSAHPLVAFRDLDGRTLMAGPGSVWVQYLEKALGVRFDLLPLTADLTSFLQDETMVRQCFVTQEPYWARQRGAKVDTLLIAESGFDPYRVIYANRDFAMQNPETVRKFVAASLRGSADFLQGDPAPALAVLSRVNKLMTPEVMAFSLGELKARRLTEGRIERGERLGLITRERLAAQIAVLQQLGLLARALTPDDVARFDLLPDSAIR
jgi:NitT/TauT family transport system substrate-binding protein